MSATRKVIHGRVGVGAKHGAAVHSDVKIIQNLLVGAKQLPKGANDGRWGTQTEKALRNFQTTHGLESTGFVDPNDDTLVNLLDEAGILITLPGSKGIAGVMRLHDWFRSHHVAYEKEAAMKTGGTRAYYGLDGEEDYVVQTNHTIFEEGPLKMNCTTYVNLMLSVYSTGAAHDEPYDADCSMYGGTANVHLAKDRYELPLVTRVSGGARFFTDADQIRAAVNSHSVYVIEIDHVRAKGVAHMVLLTNNQVYEATNLNGYICETCISSDLDSFCDRQSQKGTIFYLFGPA